MTEYRVRINHREEHDFNSYAEMIAFGMDAKSKFHFVELLESNEPHYWKRVETFSDGEIHHWMC